MDDIRLYHSWDASRFSEESSLRRGCLIAACMRRTAAHGLAGVSTSMLSSDLLTRLHHLCTGNQRQQHRGTRGGLMRMTSCAFSGPSFRQELAGLLGSVHDTQPFESLEDDTF